MEWNDDGERLMDMAMVSPESHVNEMFVCKTFRFATNNSLSHSHASFDHMIGGIVYICSMQQYVPQIKITPIGRP